MSANWDIGQNGTLGNYKDYAIAISTFITVGHSLTFPVTYNSLTSGSKVGMSMAGELFKVIVDTGVERSEVKYRLSVRTLVLLNPVTTMCSASSHNILPPLRPSGPHPSRTGWVALRGSYRANVPSLQKVAR